MLNWKVALGLTLCICCVAAAMPDTTPLASNNNATAASVASQVHRTDATRATRYSAVPTSDMGRDPALFAETHEVSSRAGSDNNCSDATLVTLVDQGDGHQIGSEVLSFVGPLNEVAGAEYPSCHGGYMACNNVWRKFTATGTDATIDCCTATATYPDSVIEVYSGTCTSRVAIGCNDDSPGCGTGPSGDVGAKVFVSGLTPGQTYLIQVACRKYGESGYTEGNYTLTVDCYTDCTINCTVGSRDEDELQPCGDVDQTHINDGCNMEDIPALFSAITCGEHVCGTSMFDGASRDTDFYRFVTPTATTIEYSATAEFVASLLILGAADTALPIGCDNYTALAANDPNEFVPCGTENPSVTLSVDAGEYWLFVAPSFDFGPVACGKKYEIELAATPCNPAPGACCDDGSCISDTSQQDCVDILGGVWYGDGTDCAAITCFTCPTGAGVEDSFYTPGIAEKVCSQSGYDPDIWNAGCGADIPDPTGAFTLIDNGETICGTSGTLLSPVAAPSDNLRDNDWFLLQDLGGAAGEWYRVQANFLGEFPAEVHVVSYTDIDNPCETWTIEETAFAEPGQPIVVKACVKIKDYAPAGQAWVIVRPYRRGAPYEVPCGVRYALTVTCAPCSDPGACCAGELGCQMLTAAECEAAGGDFYNEGVACDDPIVCCPCQTGDIAENEPDCGATPTNNGCWADVAGPPWLFGTIPSSGSSVCGTLGDDDMDWYVYNHTGGLLRWCSTCERSVRMLVLTPASTDPSTWCSETMSGWQFYSEFEKCTEDCMEIEADPGTYFLFIRRNISDGETMPCPTYYHATAESTLVGACCIPIADTELAECLIISPSECTTAGGVYQGDYTSCGDPNPCCTFECDEDGVPEGEPACGVPDDTTNGGCNSTPPVFDTTTLNGAYPVVCGTTQYDGESRDTDWYVYNHIGGDMYLWVATEFHGHVSIYADFDSGNPCLEEGGPSGEYLGGIETYADCGMYGYYLGEIEAGNVLLIVVPEFEYLIPCGSERGRYELAVASGASNPCCVTDDETGEGVCIDTWEPYCTAADGVWHPEYESCEVAPDDLCQAGPIPCAGDMNCDGIVNYDDIDYFVAALSCVGGAPGCWPPAGVPADCPWINGDCNGDDNVTYGDIDPFVGRIGHTCP